MAWREGVWKDSWWPSLWIGDGRWWHHSSTVNWSSRYVKWPVLSNKNFSPFPPTPDLTRFFCNAEKNTSLWKMLSRSHTNKPTVQSSWLPFYISLSAFNFVCCLWHTDRMRTRTELLQSTKTPALSYFANLLFNIFVARSDDMAVKISPIDLSHFRNSSVQAHKSTRQGSSVLDAPTPCAWDYM